MSIRELADAWFSKNYPNVPNPFWHGSKFFPEEESRTDAEAWWFEIGLEKLRDRVDEDVYLLCQKEGGADDFHVLRVPAQHIYDLAQRGDLDVRADGTIVSIILSAEPDSLFIDQRGKAKVDFSEYVV